MKSSKKLKPKKPNKNSRKTLQARSSPPCLVLLLSLPAVYSNSKNPMVQWYSGSREHSAIAAHFFSSLSGSYSSPLTPVSILKLQESNGTVVQWYSGSCEHAAIAAQFFSSLSGSCSSHLVLLVLVLLLSLTAASSDSPHAIHINSLIN